MQSIQSVGLLGMSRLDIHLNIRLENSNWNERPVNICTV
jgi:hypothetical protein